MQTGVTGRGTAGRILDCFCLGCETVFTLPNVFSRCVFVYYNLIFYNISGRKLGFPNSYNPTAEFRVILGSFCCLTGNCSQGLVCTRQTLCQLSVPQPSFYSLPEMTLSSLLPFVLFRTLACGMLPMFGMGRLSSAKPLREHPHRNTGWCASMVIPKPTKLTKRISHHITFPHGTLCPSLVYFPFKKKKKEVK